MLLTADAAARLAAGILGLRAHRTLDVPRRAIRRSQPTPPWVIESIERVRVRGSLHVRHRLLEEGVAHLRAGDDRAP